MKKVTVVELFNTEKNVSLGYAPVIQEKGQKSIMISDGENPVTFTTKKAAKDYGLEWIKPKN